MSCTQAIRIKTLSHPVLTGEIVNFVSSVSAIASQLSHNTDGDINVNTFVYHNSATILNVDSIVQMNSAIWALSGSGGGDINVNTFVYNNSSTILNVDSVVQANSAIWALSGLSVETDPIFNTWAAANSASFLTNITGDVRYVNITGDVMTGGLSSPSVSAGTLYIGASTIYFVDNSGSIIEYLNANDVTRFRQLSTFGIAASANWNSAYTTVNINSATWAATDLGDLSIAGDEISSTTKNVHLLANDNGRVELLATDGPNSNYLWAQTDGIGIQNNNPDGHFLWGFNPDGSTSFPDANNGVSSHIDVNGNAFFNIGHFNELTVATGNIINNKSSGLATFGYSNGAVNGVYGGFDGTNITGSYFQLFGKDGGGSGTTPPGGGEFIINSVNGPTQFTLGVYNGSTFDTKFVLNSDGKVGINQNNPEHSLEVRGDIYGALLIGQNQTGNGNALEIHHSSNDVIVAAIDDDGLISGAGGNSNQWNSSYSTVNSNSAAWILSGISVEVDPVFTAWAPISTNYNSVYSTVQGNSSTWINASETDPLFNTWANANSAHYQSTYSTVLANSATWGSGSGVETDPVFVAWKNINEPLYNSAYSTVNVNSSTWVNVPETDPVFTTWANANSAHYQSTYSTVNTNSSTWVNVPETDPVFVAWKNINEPLYNSAYSTLNSNSASWVNVAESDPIFSTWANANSAYYQSTYSTVNVNSAAWANVAETDPVFTTWANTNSANYQSTYSTVLGNSATWINVPETDPVFSTWALANSARYDSGYSTTNSNSALWSDTRTTVLNNSASWTNAAESDPIFNTWAASNSAHYQSTYSTVGTNSANWQNVYTGFQSQSSNNTSVFSTVNANSSTWGTGGGGGGGPIIGSVDNAVLRADIGGSNSQGSSVIIDDFTSSTQNNVTIKVDDGSSANIDVVIQPKGTGAFILGPKPDGTSVGGNARGVGAVDLVLTRSGSTQIASGDSSFAVGQDSVASAPYSVSTGLRNVASGYYSFAGGADCTAQYNGAFAYGVQCHANNYYTIAMGIYAYATGGQVAMGYDVQAVGSGSVAIGTRLVTNGILSFATGESNTTNGTYSVATGYASATRNAGMRSHSCYTPSGRGDMQVVDMPLFAITTNATPTECMGNYSLGERFTIPTDKALTATVTFIGKVVSGGDVFAGKRQITILNNAGTVSLIGAVNTIGVDAATAGALTWGISITADNTNKALNVVVTGQAATTIRWVVNIDGVEVLA